ncbi:MAG: deoxyribodipyrimidine photo-lyase [Ardenticatenaceae bacterium]|nr:deoxyribodipyrimidine photo-lyase [Ardenticatenaceae bacterium]
MKAAIWWIRRDLRLADNEALTAVCSRADTVIPTFIIDPQLVNGRYTGEKRLAFLWAGLRALDAQLRERGSYLVVREGAPLAELAALRQETQAEAIFVEEDYSPYAGRRDKAIAAELPLTLTGGVTVHPPSTILKTNGEPYTVFTPFSKQWRERPFPDDPGSLLPAPAQIRTPAHIAGRPLPEKPALPTAVPFPAGEAEAQRRLRTFTAGPEAPIYAYGARRNRMDLDGTAQLSPYLRFGMLSARQAVVAAREAWHQASHDNGRHGADTWLNELIWREFYISILYHFPYVLKGNFNRTYDALAWDNDAEHFAAWQNGRTGYPIIDAAMRQLAATGWMHNRARMIVASFLVKDLLIDWRWGERHFMQHLVDGDPAANNGGWQWTAGTGTDAAPYFRIFNPTTQSKKFDPDGRYIRRWVPELTAVPDAHIHEPAAMPPDLQKQCGVIVGRDYPAPTIDRQKTRQRTLEAYKQAREAV